jgi:ABC-2 type transport system permease protein
MNALRAGRARGLIELRQSLTNAGDLFNHCFWPALMLVTLYFMRDRSFGGSGYPLGTLVLPSILGMNAAMAMVTMSQALTADREDGTLLRAKATPDGVPAYLVGKVVSVSGGLLVDLAIFLVPALLLIPGLRTASPAAWGPCCGCSPWACWPPCRSAPSSARSSPAPAARGCSRCRCSP